MEKKKPRHLTASGQIKPSVRLARRNVTKDGRVPTYLSAALFNRFQEEVAQSLYSASSVTSVTSMPANECLSQEEGIAPTQHDDELGGVDWRETLKQRAIEIDRFNQLGMALPAWSTEQSLDHSAGLVRRLRAMLDALRSIFSEKRACPDETSPKH